MPVRVLTPPRHACTGCGACCQGSVVHLLDGEAEQVRVQAEALGVTRPVVEGRLRNEQGRCVFLDEARLCRIHARFGADAKPLVCRQFPFVVVQAGDEVRAGIDPATTAYRTTRLAGPDLTPPDGVRPRPAPMDEAQAAIERRLVAICAAEDATLAGLLGALCSAPAGPELPAGFAGRWIRVVQRAPLQQLLRYPTVGPDHRAVLLPVLRAAATWRADDPPAWPILAASEERFALDLIRDALWLRLLATRIPIVPGVALLLAGGALTCAWADPSPERFGPALSTWCRLLRAGPFWQSMVPTPAALQELATSASS